MVAPILAESNTIENSNINNSTIEQDNNEVSEESVKKVEKYIPNQFIKHLNKKDKENITRGNAYAILEAISLMTAEDDSPWTKSFNKGEFKLERVVPIFDLENNLSETMVIFNEGYIILDADSGNLKQFSYGSIDLSYFDENERVYINDFEHFAIGNDGKIKDGTKKNKDISEIKKELSGKIKNTHKKENKFGSLHKDVVDSLLNGFLTGANEGTSKEDFITDPRLWLLRWYPNQNSGITDLSVTLNDSLSKTIPEIDQDASPWDTYDNDCAVISTLELFRYFWGITDTTTQKKAYNAIINSSYYRKPDGGIWWYYNDDIFKVGAEAIGKNTQSTSDDPAYKLSPSYTTFKSELTSYGPGYLSINDEPYGAHTVIVKGVAKYKTTFKDRYSINRTYYDEFIRINDHWTAQTPTDAFMHLGHQNGTWYLQSIKPN